MSMAALELVKAFEALKIFQSTTSPEEVAKKKEQVLSKREKVLNCNVIADNICAVSLRSAVEFPKFLGISIELFLRQCDDTDSDVRMAADECLNRTIKTLLETNLGRIQVELYKEIKKNGAYRSLRAALWRFADMAHLIRPQKCRPYMINLMPCLANVCCRPEETIQETMAVAMTKICPVLAAYATDTEAKALMKAFLPNLASHTASTRRAATSALTAVCRNVRKPATFIASLLNTLLDMILPVDTSDRCVYQLQGALLCLRHLVVDLATPDGMLGQGMSGSFGEKVREAEAEISLQQLTQLYEALLFYCGHSDHNVVVTCLETLQQLLRNVPPLLLDLLLTPGGISTSSIYASDMVHIVKSSGGGSLSNLPMPNDEASLEDDLDRTSDTSTSASLSDEPTSLPGGATDTETPPGDRNENYNATDDAYSAVEIGSVDEDDAPAPVTHSASADTLSDVGPRLKQSASVDGLSVDDSPVECQHPLTQTAGDVGSVTDADTTPLLYCCRLLCARFLLSACPRGMMPDSAVRVSIKALATGCVAAIVKLDPTCFLASVYKTNAEQESVLQYVSDVLMYSNHSDPQLKGTTAIIVGGLISAALTHSRGSFASWLAAHSAAATADMPTLDELVGTLISLLEDKMSVTARLALDSVQTCLTSILNSVHLHTALRLLRALLRLKTNTYWLMKVKLLEVLSEVNFKVVAFTENHCAALDDRDKHFLGPQQLQKRALDDVVNILLADPDPRVRHAAATCLVNFVPHLFFPADVPHGDPVISVAHDFTSAHLEPVMHEWSLPPSPGLGPIAPYCESRSGANVALGWVLSRIVARIMERLNCATNKHITYGCIHALCLLAQRYPTTQHSTAWGCLSMCGRGVTPQSPGLGQTANLPSRSLSTGRSVGSAGSVTSQQSIPLEMTACGGPLPLILALLTSTPVGLHLASHEDAILLAADLFAGAAYKCIQNPEHTQSSDVHWVALSDRQLVDSADQLFMHIARLLNIICHILEETAPGPPVTKTSLPSLPNAPSLSPIRRRAKGLKEEGTQATQPLTGTTEKNTTKSNKDQSKDNEKGKKEGVGTFYRSPQYMRLYEVTKIAYASYKISLELSTSTDRFTGLVRAVLVAFAKLLEVCSLQETGQHAEELLGYLKASVSICPTESILCVQQLLKSLFGTNLASQWEGDRDSGVGGGARKPGTATRLVNNMRPGLYHACFTAPYTQFTQSLGGATYRTTATSDQDETSGLISWLKKKAERKIPNILKSGSKTDKTSVASYIRLFEPLVIRALKQYTMTSCLQLQTRVLQLLSQLVQLRVNYCLLDSDQIFLGFIIKQFEYIEEGQMRNADILIPHIFNFFVLLSYERYHSKSVIGMPKIIQLCDGIMASGQDPVKHAVPALQAIVQDLFVVRAAAKLDVGKDIDTQREVVVSMLLRLLRYHQVLEMMLLVLHECRRDNDEKWKRLSRQVVDLILPMLTKQQINLHDRVSLDVVHRLFESVAPSVFRPVDMLLLTLFAVPHDLSSIAAMQRWLASVLAVLRVLISQSTEEVVLLRMQELSLVVSLPRSNADGGSPVPLLPAPQTLARFIFQVIGLVAERIDCVASRASGTSPDGHFLHDELSHLLLYAVHMFQSGIYRRVSGVATAMLREETPPCFYSVRETNARFASLAGVQPTLALQWANVLILLNYDDQAWWANLMCTQRKYLLVTSSSPVYDDSESFCRKGISCSFEIVRQGSLILFSDYVCENLSDAEHMTWVIINHVNDLIQLSHEPPVQYFISAIHRNSAASGLFIQAIHSSCENFAKPDLILRALHCLSATHAAQSGALLVLLVDAFLSTAHRAVAMAADKLACHRLESLLADTQQESSSQLPLDDLNKLILFMHTEKLTKRHSRLMSLMTKLREVFTSSHIPLSTTDKSFALEAICSDVTVDKEWYISFVQECCVSCSSCPLECATLLSCLDHDSIFGIISNPSCSTSILIECITLGKHKMAPPPALGTPPQCSPLLSAASAALLARAGHLVSAEHTGLVSGVVDGVSYDVFAVGTALLAYLDVTGELPVEHVSCVARCALIPLQRAQSMLTSGTWPTSDQMYVAVQCAAVALQWSQLRSVLSDVELVNSAIHATHQLLSAVLLLPGDRLVIQPTPIELASHPLKTACEQISELVYCLLNHLSACRMHPAFPQFLADPLRKLIIGLARLPAVNSYARTPPLVWSLGWAPTISEHACDLPPLPLEFIQEKDVLREFVSRINLLGWTSRQQFEETWMLLLGVVNPASLTDEQLAEPEEDAHRNHCAVLATRALTALLLQAGLQPHAGDPASSTPEHTTRNHPLGFLDTKVGQQLSEVRGLVDREVVRLCRPRKTARSDEDGMFYENAERVLGIDEYQLAQISIESIWPHIGLVNSPVSSHASSSTTTPPVSPLRHTSVRPTQRRALASCGVDVHSCVQFLLELYGQLLSPIACPRTPLMQLNDTIKSVVLLSDLFTDASQYVWMLNTFAELQRTHPAEDELVAQYLVVGVCKAAAVVGLEADMLDRIIRIIETSLRSPHLPTKMSALYGSMYILEAGIPDLCQQVALMVAEYLLRALSAVLPTAVQSQQHVLIMWSLAFYIIENYQELHDMADFTQTIVQMAVSLASQSDDTVPISIYLVLLRGLERLLLAGVLTQRDAETLIKLGVDRLCLPNPQRALSALGLMLTCMYAGKQEDQWSPTRMLQQPEFPIEGDTSPDPESLILAMERVTLLFDRIRKGFVYEARVIARVLPGFLADFFPPENVMNKVISEFLSGQQPHPQIMATVVFHVFEGLLRTDQHALVYDWVMLSLSNFTQRTPIAMAIWSFTCFFISALDHQWLHSLLPYAIGRMGRLTDDDRRLFVLVARHFHARLTSNVQRREFVATFQAVAQAERAYADLVAQIAPT